MSTPLLKVSAISASYGPIQALRNVTLEVYSGEIVTLIGCNGAGKSTTLMCISAIKQISRGEIHFEDKAIHSIPSHELVARGLAQVPEGRKIFPRLSVRENLEMGAYLRKKDSLASDYERIFTLFPILKDRAAQLGGTLSGGEQQMLAIGRALMSRPKLLLLDEPSMGIAPLLVQKIFRTIRELNSEGMTILLVEQNATAALQLAHRGYVLETGETIMSGKASTLLSDSRVREAYLGDEALLAEATR